MNTYLLVHGSWHGAWCWEKVVPLLTQAGHQVITLDLPGHGNDQTPAAEVSLQTYADSICKVLDAQPEAVILVGHSMGGIAVSQAAEYRPQKIKMLIFLAAALLRDGESASEVVQPEQDPSGLPSFTIDESQGTVTIRKDVAQEILYGNCSDENAAQAILRLCPEPLAPLTTPLKLSQENFGRIPRFYIECLRDQTVSPMTQKKMYTATPCREVQLIDTDHSPFFSAPEELVKILTAFPSENLSGF
jgi:pimeloyl-ACP methyl ester carboxylesterase